MTAADIHPYAVPGLMSIEDAVCDVFNVTMDEINKTTRIRKVTESRQVIMWYYRTYKGFTFHYAGRIVKRDHCTAMYACNTVDCLRETDKEFGEKLRRVLSMVKR